MSRSLDVYKKCDLRESDECESTLSLVVNVKIIAMRNNMLLDVDGTHRCLALGLLDSLVGSATITFGCLIVYEILFREMRILLSHAASGSTYPSSDEHPPATESQTVYCDQPVFAAVPSS